MKIGFIGLGKMGFNMVENLLDKKHKVITYDLNTEAVNEIIIKGAVGTSSISDLAEQLHAPKIIWLMVPAGNPVDKTIDSLIPFLSKGDIIIDGGNSNYKDSIRRAERLKKENIYFLDAGTSGGLSGARKGACMMIGGERKAFELAEQLFKDMCVKNGYGYVGKPGAGHFVKMIHNGIEYGMMQAIGEGFDILESSNFDLDMKDIARIWSNGSVIRGWLMELTENAFSKDPELAYLSGEIADSGEGAWTVQAALDFNVAIPVISNSLLRRYRSRKQNPLSDKVVAALRDEFGGHGFKRGQNG